MSYLSATENVGFSGIPQTISDGSCATQFKLEGVTGNCSEVMYIQDSSTDDSNYITQLNDNYYTKFKIDPNELYTFHDSDVVAGEITVSHTEDTFVFSDSDESKQIIDNGHDELVLDQFTNGDVEEFSKQDVGKNVHLNGHYGSQPISKETKTSNTKVQKAKGPIKEVRRESLSDARKQAHSPKSQAVSPNLNSINSIESNLTPSIQNKGNAIETFLDVFKREQGLMKNEVKTEPSIPPLVKIPMSPAKKSAVKTPSQAKPRRGRGPAVHEALQRISHQKALAIPNMTWHAPGDNLFDCGPLDNKIPAFKLLDSSSSDDDYMPDFESGHGPVSIEEHIPQPRGSRLSLRRAALRRHVARATHSLALAHAHTDKLALATVIRKQLNSAGSSGSLPIQTVNHLLAMRGMSALLSSQERRKLRLTGIPHGRGCGPWPERHRLFAAAAAACRLPPPHDAHTHAQIPPAKPVKEKPRRPRRAVTGPRRPRRRPPPVRPPPPPPPALTPTLAEMRVCSNSSYDSSEEAMALSGAPYIAPTRPLEVEVGNVPPDDILDPAVLSQISDETFTEFFNQGIVLADSGATFSESPELAAALEAVLDERTLTDERTVGHIGQFGHEGQVGHTVLIGHTVQTDHLVQSDHVGQTVHVGQRGQVVRVGHDGHIGQVARIGHSGHIGHASRNIYIHSPQHAASDKIQAPTSISMEVSTLASS